MCTLAVSIYVRPVSIVAGFDLELFGMLERELLGTSAWDRPDSGTREEVMLRADSGLVRALPGTASFSCLAELTLLDLNNEIIERY